MNILDIAIAKKLAGGGGGSGTDNYNDLSNLPKINDTTLSGNKSSSALGLQSEINSDSKLASDLVDDTNQDNKFVTSTEKNTWNAKQNAIDSDHKLSSSLVSFSTAEAAALASGIDSSKVGQISTNQTNISSLQDAVNTKLDKTANAASAAKLNNGTTDYSVGSATKGVYFNNGVPTAMTHSVNTDVPLDAVFTDTTYSSKAAASGGTDVSLCTTGEKYTWNNKGTYSKPSGGIPKSDLASAVQTSLGNADTAYSALSKVSKNIARVEKSFTSTQDVLSSTGCKYTTQSNKVYRITAWAEYGSTNPLAVAIVNSTNGAVFGYAEHPSGLTNIRVTATAIILGVEAVEIKAKYAGSATCAVGMIVEELSGV